MQGLMHAASGNQDASEPLHCAAGTTTSTSPSWAPSASLQRAACRSHSGRIRCAASCVARQSRGCSARSPFIFLADPSCQGPLPRSPAVFGPWCLHRFETASCVSGAPRGRFQDHAATGAGEELGWHCAGQAAELETVGCWGCAPPSVIGCVLLALQSCVERTSDCLRAEVRMTSWPRAHCAPCRRSS